MRQDGLEEGDEQIKVIEENAEILRQSYNQ
jgi:hypothetical protein